MPGGTCSVEGCEAPFHCRTWCRSHYSRWRSNGDPLAGNRSPRHNAPIMTNADAPPGHRYCRRCKTIKPFSEFHKNANRPDGVTFYCKVCNSEYDDNQRARDPEAYLARRRRATYRYILKRRGMTSKSYDQLFAEHNGECAICHRPETSIGRGGIVKPLCLDHDHLTGLVRGLLCNSCNQGLGAFGDDIVRLAAAIEYLTTASTPP